MFRLERLSAVIKGHSHLFTPNNCQENEKLGDELGSNMYHEVGHNAMQCRNDLINYSFIALVSSGQGVLSLALF